MMIALTLLLITLGIVLYHDRDFWFPASADAENQPLQTPAPAATTAASPRETPPQHARSTKREVARSIPVNDSAPVMESPAPPLTITRTVLPPLEVEVIAGSSHKTLHPGTNSVHVDLQPDPSSQEAPEASVASIDVTAADVTKNAAEQTKISPETADVVTQSVRPGYPMLARQMKVQGSVILEALIGRDGLIQDLHVISGPPILATAAREAVKQWHFKPHYEGAEAVETQAKITVNFTISTN